MSEHGGVREGRRLLGEALVPGLAWPGVFSLRPAFPQCVGGASGGQWPGNGSSPRESPVVVGS